MSDIPPVPQVPFRVVGKKGTWTVHEDGPEESVRMEGIWFPLPDPGNWGIVISRPAGEDGWVHVAERSEPEWDSAETFSDVRMLLHARDFLAYRQLLMD